MTILKEKHPVKSSFESWLALSNGVAHPMDEKRFFIFVKSVHAYHATIWKDVNFLKKKILENNPNFDRGRLQRILDLYPVLLRFCRVKHQKIISIKE